MVKCTQTKCESFVSLFYTSTLSNFLNGGTLPKYKFQNKKFPLINGQINFETLINNFIERNKKSFSKYISLIVQVESRDYIFYTIG